MQYNIDNDFKFTVQPKINGELLDLSGMVDLKVLITNKKNGDFEPIWKLTENGIEIEVQKEHISLTGTYYVEIQYRRPDGSYSDFFQDKKLANPVLKIVPLGIESDSDGQTAVIEVSPEYKGADGITPHIGENGNWFIGDEDTGIRAEGEDGENLVFESLSEEDVLLLQKPARDAAQIAIDAANEAEGAAQHALSAAESANEATSSANGKIGDLNALETAIGLAESQRAEDELSRQSSESTRAENEVSRQSAETTRSQNETQRTSAETQRVNSENARQVAETARGNNEVARQGNETTRQSKETARQSAENAREEAEQLRETNTQTAINNAETATSNANEQGNYAKQQADEARVLIEALGASSKLISSNYTLQQSDNLGVIAIDSPNNLTITVPVGLSAGFQCNFFNLGNADTTFVAASGVTLTNVRSTFTMMGQYSGASIMTHNGILFLAGGDLY